MTKFFWPAYPKSNAEFEELMSAIDGALAAEGLKPFQRPMHVGKKLWEAFGWSGQLFPPKELADLPGFTGDILKAKSYRWYEVAYGDQLKADMAYGFAPARLGNSIWRVRAGLMYGAVQLFLDRNLANRGVSLGSKSIGASFNVLCAVEGLPQGLVDRLSDQALKEHFDFHIFVHENLQWRSSLPRIEMLDMAHNDYDQSTADVLAHRYGQARWGAQQAVEKTMKGFLSIAGSAYPTGGPNGHNLHHLAQILKQRHGIAIADALLDSASCSPKVRYGEEVSTEAQALLANHSVLGVIEQIRLSPKIDVLLSSHNKPE